MALAETARLAVRIDLEGNASKGVQKLNRQIGGLGSSVARVGKGVGQVGAGFAKAGLLLGGAAVTGITAAAKAAIDFEDAFAGVRKTVSATPEELNAIALAFRKMATEIPIAATELANIGEQAGALGIKTKDISEFTRVVAELGVTTDLTSDSAAEALGKVGTILNLTGKDFEHFADVLVNLGNNGASTESAIIEITKRFAAAGHQAGLSTEQILAMASAVASMGIEPEAAGGALSRTFNQMAQNIALANKKGQAFAKITGKSIKELQSDINKGKGFEVFKEFLEGLQGLSKTDFAKALKRAGITNVRDANAILLMAQNMGFFNDQVKIAESSTGALAREAGIKFNTIKSKLIVLKNSAIEAGIAIGEGMLPAIGRAADKLRAFLNDPANKNELKTLGEDLGKAIDNIDWNEVLTDAKAFVGVLKSTLSIVLDIVSAINKLPTEVKAAAASLLILNKASGGLIGAGLGNIAGGIGESIVRGIGSKVPKVGSLFAQPVFVTNWPVGGVGGGPGAAAGGMGGAAKVAVGATIIGGIALSAESINDLAQKNASYAAQGLNPAEIAAIRYYQSSATDQAFMAKRLGRIPSKADYDAALAKLGGALKEHEGKNKDDIVATAKKASSTVNAKTLAVQRSVDRDRADTVARLSGVRAQTASSGSAIVSAIYANRPIITTNVSVSATTVTKVTNVQKNYGNNHPSRNADPKHNYGGGY